MYTPIRKITITNIDFEIGKNYDKIPEGHECWFREVEAKKKSKGAVKK